MNAVVKEVREFACETCGLNTATYHPDVIECDECAHQRMLDAAGEYITCSDCGDTLSFAVAAKRRWILDGDAEGLCPACQIADARGVFL